MSIIIPLLNEIDSIDSLINRLQSIPANCEFIFVDDGSSDGTREEIILYANIDKRIKCVFNQNRLGHMGSYIEGLKNSLSNYIIIMDGDLQHPPEKIVEMLTLLESGFDIVIGSRYEKNKFIGERDKFRGVLSRGAEFSLKMFVRECRRLSDPVSGFIGFRKDLIIPINKNMKGNKLLPFLVVANRNTKITHINYAFRERKFGVSKIVNSSNNFLFKFLKEIIEIRKVRKSYRSR